MKAKDLRWYLLGYFALLIIAMMLHSGESIGINANWINEDYSYLAGAAPWAIAFAVVGSGLYVLTTLGKVSPGSVPLPLLLRRWMAGFIDFFVAFLIPGTYLGLAAVLIEFSRTGVFEWIVERHVYQAGDGQLALVSVLLMMFGIMPAYFVFSWTRGKPTPGSCICNFRIVADDGSVLPVWKAWLRALLGAIALLAWPCWILAFWLKRDKAKGKFWLDQVFKTHAEILE